MGVSGLHDNNISQHFAETTLLLPSLYQRKSHTGRLRVVHIGGGATGRTTSPTTPLIFVLSCNISYSYSYSYSTTAFLARARAAATAS